MTFEGFGENMEAVISVVAGVAYPQFTVKELYRLDDLGSSNLGVGWTSMKLGFSTMMDSKGTSCIQTAHNLRRFELIDKEDQPVVGARINEGDGITREIGWMAVKDKGSLTHFERADKKVVSIKPIADRPRHQGRSTIVTQNKDQQSCSKLPKLSSDKDKCLVDKPANLIQQDEKITLESLHQAEAAEASSTWRGKKVESQKSKRIQRIKKVTMKEKDKEVMHTLFDGAGGLGMSLNELGKFDLSQQRIVACDNRKGARLLCDSTNRKEDGSPMIDHDWCHDVMDIIEQTFIYLGNIIMFAGGAPCGDCSRKRNLRQRNGKMPTTYQRSGFKGKAGILFKHMVKIWRWVKKHNPDCDYFIENVAFDDMKEWEYICDAFGEPTVVNSKYQSFTARSRAYSTSFKIPTRDMLYEARQWQTECHDA